MLAQYASSEGQYVCLGSAETVESNRARIDGAVRLDFYKCTRYDRLLIPQYCDNDLERGMAIVNDWITANPDLKAIFLQQ